VEFNNILFHIPKHPQNESHAFIHNKQQEPSLLWDPFGIDPSIGGFGEVDLLPRMGATMVETTQNI